MQTPASTPQGCIWNETDAGTMLTVPSGFNPSRVHLELPQCRHCFVNISSRFNPSRVHLELSESGQHTQQSRASTPQGSIWNSTRSKVHVPGESASTPQGCIWNRVNIRHDDDGKTASTPQGCIWNSPSSTCSKADVPGFNPSRVHLELGVGVVVEVDTWLQPLKGASGTMHTTAVADVLLVDLRS